MTKPKKIKIDRFIVSAIDYGDSCDGKARILFCSQFEDEAKAYVENDIKDYIDNNSDDDGNCCYIADFGKMKITDKDNENNGCEWNIEKISIEISIDELDKSFFK